MSRKCYVCALFSLRNAWSFAAGCELAALRFPRFCRVLHTSALLSTGCAQRGNGFELRCGRSRVQSLNTHKSSSELSSETYEDRSCNLPFVRGHGLEGGSKSARAWRHALRLPVAGSRRRHDCCGTHSE